MARRHYRRWGWYVLPLLIGIAAAMAWGFA
jgi:hypothetical protein